MVKRLFWLLLFLLPLLAACSGSGEPAAAPGETAVQAETLSAANQPQLIEFYADW